MNTPYRAFWACEDTFGKTWGLLPRVEHCICTMMIRPALTCGHTVWWLRVRYNVSRRKLSKLQKLACLAITGVMKATPTAATDILGLPPLHVMIEEEAQVGIYRLICIKQWRPKSTNFSNTEKSSGMEHEPILQMGSDRMLPRCAYHMPFMVKFLDKC
jgi:hypothetical protein